MISATEIVRMAEAMAQVQNTDALSWRDKTDMLNHGYRRLYEDVNNAGDLYFVKEVEIERKHEGPEIIADLPADLFKLLFVGYRANAGDPAPILRAPNATPFENGYRLINNRLVLFGFNHGRLVIRYIPLPSPIFYSKEGVPVPKAPIAAYDGSKDVIVLGNPKTVNTWHWPPSSADPLVVPAGGRLLFDSAASPAARGEVYGAYVQYEDTDRVFGYFEDDDERIVIGTFIPGIENKVIDAVFDSAAGGWLAGNYTLPYGINSKSATETGTLSGFDFNTGISLEPDPGNITVIDRKSGETRALDIEGLFTLSVADRLIYVVRETKITVYDYALTEVKTLNGSFDLYSHPLGWDGGIVVSSGGVFYRYTGSLKNIVKDTWDYSEGKITKDGGVFTYTGKDGERDITLIFEGADSYVIADPYIYVNKDRKTTGYHYFTAFQYAPRIRPYGEVLAAAVDPNPETGYGVIYRDYNRELFLQGFTEDTVLNYPKNIFYDVLTVDLAIKIRVSLDIPSGELPNLLEDYQDTLMRGMSRDSYSPARINNVYSKGI
jgi:hypothetical protein